MEITFDLGKDLANRAKHGMSLADARLLDWDSVISRQDSRHDYGEIRMIGIGYIRQRLHVVVYHERNDACRVISLRKANRREEKYYAKT